MALRSRILSGDAKLEAAAVSNPAHIKRGAAGEHVAKIHKALKQLDSAVIDKDELRAKKFGPSTEEAVLNYKKKRKIINRAYQSDVDPIVGIMTMAALDKELVKVEASEVEAAVLGALATALGYNPRDKLLLTSDSTLRRTMSIMKERTEK
jgi:peptidoglycan hydrolase-like protein with peptidoglycan-binding domain